MAIHGARHRVVFIFLAGTCHAEHLQHVTKGLHGHAEKMEDMHGRTSPRSKSRLGCPSFLSIIGRLSSFPEAENPARRGAPQHLFSSMLGVEIGPCTSSWVISLGDSLVLLSRPQSRFLSFLRWRSPDGSWLEGFVPDCDSVVVQGCFVHDVGCDCDSRKLLFRGSLLPAGGGGQFLTWVIPSA
ncbi:hypothetical protein Dimus_031302 [Dionaea muscipula]